MKISWAAGPRGLAAELAHAFSAATGRGQGARLGMRRNGRQLQSDKRNTSSRSRRARRGGSPPGS